MAKKGLTQANTLRSNNTTSTGYGIVYADEIIGSRSVKTKEDLNKLPDWVLGKDNKLEKGTTYYVENEKCFYIYTGDGWQKSFKSIGLPVKSWYAYDNDVTGTAATSQILDISKIIKGDDLYVDTQDGIEEQPHPFATIVVYNDEVNKVPIAYITLFESSDPDNPENNTVVASAKVFGVITNNVFPKTPNFSSINYYEGNCRPLDTGTQITNWKHTGGNSIVDKVWELNDFSIKGNTIKTSEIDFTTDTLQKFNDSISSGNHVIKTQYSVVDVTHDNIVGQMLLIGDSLGHMVTEILTTSAELKDGVIDWNAHSDTEVNTYIRRNHVKEGGTSSIAVGSWSKWTYYSGEGQFNDFKKLVAGELNKKVNTSDVVQQTGGSTTSVMSQKAVTDAIQAEIDRATESEQANAQAILDGNDKILKLDVKKIDKPTLNDIDLNVTDKSNNVVFKIDKEGLKARKYNLVSENGEVVYELNEDFFKSLVNLISSIKNDLNNALKVNDTDTDLSVIDKNNNISFRVDKEGLKARKINILNGYGDIVGYIDESFFEEQSISDKDGLGETCKMQEKKGTYCMPTIMETTDYVKAVYDTNNAKFGDKCIKVYSEGVPVSDDDNWTTRGKVVLNFDNPVEIKETVSIWMYVPSCYCTTSRNGSKSTRSLAVISIDIEGVSVWITEYNYIPGGWFLYKLTTDSFVGKTLSSCTLRFGLYNRNPLFVAYIGYFVIDQRMIPTFNFNMDANLLSNTYNSGFVSYIKENNLPLNARIPTSNATLETEGYSEGLSLYMSGVIDGLTYTAGVNEAKTVSAGVDKLLNNGMGKNNLQDNVNCVRPIIAAACNTNYADDFVVTCLKEAGFKIARAKSVNRLTSYFDKESMIVPCMSYGAIPDANTYPTYQDWIDAGKTDDDLQTRINTHIEKGKIYIDNCIKYGCFGNLFTHDLCTLQQYKDGQHTTVSAFYEVVVAILNYAIEKQNNGELRIMTLDNFYKRCVTQ